MWMEIVADITTRNEKCEDIQIYIGQNEQHESHSVPVVTSGAPEGSATPSPLVIHYKTKLINKGLYW